MVKGHIDSQLLLSPGLRQAPVLDRMCSHFVLSLTMRNAGRFNLRRDWNSLLSLTGRHLVWQNSVLARLRDFLKQRCKGNEHWLGHEALSDDAFLARHGGWRGPYEEGTLFFYIDEYIKDSPKDLLATLGTTADWLARSLKKESTLVEKNIDALAGLLQLNPAERALLLYGTLARYQRDLRGLLVEFKVSNAQEAYAAIAGVAGVNAGDVAEALRAGSRLERIGMVENLISEHNITDLADLMKVSEQLPQVLMRKYEGPSDLMAVFTRPAKRTQLSEADFDFVSVDQGMIIALLRNAVARKEPGVNVLLYGPPGTGKTELAKVAAQAAGLELYEVEYADRDGNSLSGRDRYRSLQISQVFLKGSGKVALLFDEVEDVFPPISTEAAQLMARMDTGDGGPTGSVSGKAWVNQLLETNPVPVIWVTNRIEQIDLAFRRRFQYHLELKSPPPGARELLVSRALSGVAVDSEFYSRLAARSGLTPAQIRTAVKFAQLAGDGTAVQAADRAPTRQCRQSLGQWPGRTCRAPGRDAVRPLPGEHRITIRGAQDHRGLAAQALRYAVFLWPARNRQDRVGRAHRTALQRPLMIRQASDLVSKFVGETEQNMAKMFDEAQAEEAVLLLDEADSFLRSRRLAERSYEISEVNEMLQGMERFSGIFICTTNLFIEFDEAALRRFTFKIQFKPLTLRSGSACSRSKHSVAPPPRSIAAVPRLARLEALTLGDFASVKRQVDILGEVFDPDEFLSQLEAEHRVKPEVRQQRGIGFVH